MEVQLSADHLLVPPRNSSLVAVGVPPDPQWSALPVVRAKHALARLSGVGECHFCLCSKDSASVLATPGSAVKTSYDMAAAERQPNFGLRRMSPDLKQNDAFTTRYGDCSMICTYNARTISSNAYLHALLDAAERIKFHVNSVGNLSRRKRPRKKV